jgi:hypothetical protein
METLFETDSLDKMEQAVATAFFKGYGLFFTYYKVNKEDSRDLGTHERRVLETISDLKYNDDSDILVCGCIDHEGNYRKFFLENMSNVSVFKKVVI